MASIPSGWVFILTGAAPALLNFLPFSGQHTCSRGHLSSSQQLIVQELYWTLKRPLVEILLTLWLSCFSYCPEENVKKQMGCAQRKRHESLFFTASFKKKVFLQFAWGNFFLIVCTYGYKLKCTVTYREKEQKPKSTFPTATPFFCPLWNFQQHFPEPRRQPAQACKWFVFKMYISGAFNKMRGNGFINNVVFF